MPHCMGYIDSDCGMEVSIVKRILQFTVYIIYIIILMINIACLFTIHIYSLILDTQTFMMKKIIAYCV